MYQDNHWRQSALNSAGVLQGGGGEFWGIFTPFYTIRHKSGGARATVASPSLAPLKIIFITWKSIHQIMVMEVFSVSAPW